MDGIGDIFFVIRKWNLFIVTVDKNCNCNHFYLLFTLDLESDYLNIDLNRFSSMNAFKTNTVLNSML